MTVTSTMEDISNNKACTSCRGMCCTRFAIEGPVFEETGLPDWDSKYAAFVKNEKPPQEEIDRMYRELAFIKAHFIPIRQPNDSVMWTPKWHIPEEMPNWATLWYACTALKDGKCSEYENRPKLCKAFLCESARDYGINPELAITIDDTGKVYPMFFYPGVYDLNRLEEGIAIDTNFVKPINDDASYRAGMRDIRAAVIEKLPQATAAAIKREGMECSVEDWGRDLQAIIKDVNQKRDAALKEAGVILGKLDAIPKETSPKETSNEDQNAGQTVPDLQTER